MATNNAWNSNIPVSVAKGGTGSTSLTSGGVLLGNTTSALDDTGVLNKGTLIAGDGTGAPSLRAAGTDDYFLVGDTSESTGLDYDDLQVGAVIDPTDASNSIWSLFGDPKGAYSDWSGADYGSEGTNMIVSSGAIVINTSEVGHPGVRFINAGYSRTTDTLLIGDGEMTITGWIKKAGNLSEGWFGLSTTITQNPSDGIFWYQDFANWTAYTTDGGTATTTASSVSIGSWNKLEIVINAAASSVVFKIDGTTHATHTTNIPSTSDTYFLAIAGFVDGIWTPQISCDLWTIKTDLTGDRA